MFFHNAIDSNGVIGDQSSFGLPASSGKAFVDKIWNARISGRDYWNGVLYMLALLHVSGNFHLYY